MRRIYLIICLLFFQGNADAQFYYLHAEYRNDWYAGTYALNPNFAATGYDQVTVQAQSSNDQFVIENSTNNNKWYNPAVAFNTITNLTFQTPALPAVIYDNYLTTPTTVGKYYTHIMEYNGYANSRGIVMETTNSPVSISTVTPYGRVCGLNNAFTVKVDLSANKSPEEVMYVRYCLGNNFGGGATGVVRVNFQSTTSNSGYAYIPMSGTGLPTLANGNTVWYYVFSSTVTGITAAMTQNDINLYTLRANTNGAIGANYNFVINTSYYTALPLAGTYNVSTSTNPDMIDGNYTFSSLATAVNVLDNNGVSANVTFNIPTSFTETAPSGGYQVIYNTTTCAGLGAVPLANFSNATQTVTFQKSGSGTNPLLTASASNTLGAITDAVVKIIGADYVTFDAVDVQENSLNNADNKRTEWGYALLYASATDGAQNNTIKNCAVSLNKAYTNTFGIYSNTRHTATSATATADISAATGANSNNKFYTNTISNVNLPICLVGSGTAAYMDSGNDIGGTILATGNTISNWGGAAPGSGYVSVTSTCFGIYANHQAGINIQYNTINSGTTATTVTMRGIVVDYTVANPTGTFTNEISNNTVTINGQTSGNSSFTAIECGVTGNTGTIAGMSISVQNNKIQSCALSPASGSPFMRGIFISGTGSSTVTINSINISGNTFSGNASSQTSGYFYGIEIGHPANTPLGIYNSYINSSSLTISGNTVGGITFSGALSNVYMILNATNSVSVTNAITGNIISGITYGVAASGFHYFINNLAAGSTSTLNINSNIFQNISYTVAGANTIYFISNSGTARTQTINANQFVSLSVNTTGSITFIENSTSLPASGTKDISSNSIVTSFNKTASSGSDVITFYQDIGSSNATSTAVTNNYNNFSNITCSGNTSFNGWRNNDGASAAAPATKAISNNKFSNISTGSGYVTVMDIANGGSITISSDTIAFVSSATSGSFIQGLKTGNGTTYNIYQNLINTISATGTGGSIYGFYSAGGTTLNFYRNRIYDFTNSATGSFASTFGINLTGGTTANIYNNMVANLKAVTATDANAVSGIHQNSVTTTNLYYNSVVLSGSSTSGTGGSSGISIVGSGTLGLRNNIIINKTTPGGTGLTVALRRGTTSLVSYATASNNNIFYAGTPGVKNLIYYDGTNSYQNFSGAGSFQTAVATRESSSYSYDISFTNTTTADLHTFDPGVLNRGQDLSGLGITKDYDDEDRKPLCNGTDIGADEVYYSSGTSTYTWTGATDNSWCTACNWDRETVPVSTNNVIIPSSYVNALIINGSAGCTTPACNNVTINNGAVVTINNASATLSVNGNFANSNTSSSNFSHTAGTISFTGTTLQTINSSSQLNLANVTMNQGAGGSVTLNTDATMSGTLILTNGIITVNTGKIFAFTPAATYTGGSNASYVNGKMRQIVNNGSTSITSFTLPVGKSGFFGPVGTSNLSGTAANDYFDGEYFLAYPGSIYSVNYNGHLSPPVYHASMIEYWNLVPNNNSITGKTVLYFPDKNRSVIYNSGSDTLRVLNWNGTQWVDLYNTSAPSVPVAGAGGFITSVDNALTGWGKFTFGTTQTNPGLTILPTGVKLFEAVKQNGYNNLHWEVSCSGKELKFEVQRSKDGRSFETLNSFAASQTRCSQPFDYRDYNATGEKIYYRIRITDENGKVIYTRTALIINRPGGFEITGLMPNPATHIIYINISSAVKSKIHFSLTDIAGKRILNREVLLTAGFNMVPLYVNHLANGQYTISAVYSSGETVTLRFVKQ